MSEKTFDFNSQPTSAQLTPSQYRVLEFIQSYIEERDYAPSLAEIAAGVGMRSRSAMHRHVQVLAAAGCIILEAGRKRGIRLPAASRSDYCLPLLGRIAAGKPIEAIPGHDVINLAEFVLGEGRYALRVSGDSMITAGILDGDTVIIRQQDYANSGDIVVALIDQLEVTLKRLQLHRHNMLELRPENPNMVPMIYSAERVTIQGVVISQLRNY